MDNERELAAKKTHEGFTITCDACGGRVVAVENSLGYSETSGTWGTISLKCQDCDAYVELFEP